MRPGDSELTSSVLDDIVVLTESDIFRRLESLADCETHDPAFALTGEFTTLPTGFKGFRRAPRVNGATYYRLELASSSQIDDDCDPNVTDLPRYYCIEANKLRVGPPPTVLTLNITYFARATPITDTTSNFLLDENPDLYLYGGAVHAAPFIGEDGRMSMWKGFYEQAVTTIRDADHRRKYSGTPGQMRIPGGTP
jgi:hypothetical protein